MIVLLEEAVVGVRDVAPNVQHSTRGLVAKTGAVRHGARVTYGVWKLGVVEAGRRLQHTPFLLKASSVSLAQKRYVS